MPHEDALDRFQEEISYRFRDVSLLQAAMMHSACSPAERRAQERLEFLGDAVAALVVVHFLYGSPVELSEGDMTVIKSSAVSCRSFADAGRRLNLRNYLQVEPGLAQREEYPASVVANAYEAVVGAIFLDGGLDAARDFVLRSLAHELEAARQRSSHHNCKSILQQVRQAEGHCPPVYRVAQKMGPEHERRFMVAVELEGVDRGYGWGNTKKDAEQKAARCALDDLYPGWGQPDAGT